MRGLTTFVALNRRICRAITPAHMHEANVIGMYRKVGAMLLSHPGVSRVVDVGAGSFWHFPRHYKDWYGIHLIGLDIDGSEMAPNKLLDEKIECDVVQAIPLKPGSVDLFMVRSGIEHFADNEAFLRNAFAALRPGGFLLAQFPSRYAPFAIINRLLPPRLSRRLLDTLVGSADELGFRAYYDRTHYSGFREICSRTGFRELYYLPGYYSSSYFEFFVPLYLISYVYDVLRFAIGIRNLASYNLWILQKPETATSKQPFWFYAWDYS